MGRRSAGLLIYRKTNGSGAEVLLVHPGGPFFTNKDNGFWSVPKGEIEEHEVAFEVALREFGEETGNRLPPQLHYHQLPDVRNKSGKTVTVWTAECDLIRPYISSNTFPLEWPPRSGNIQFYPEADNAGWFSLETAAIKIYPFQRPLLEGLKTLLRQISPTQKDF
ncbi:MAG TPA: NUDIX domain-containing protein [Sphingobacteriaceae bacterium]